MRFVEWFCVPGARAPPCVEVGIAYDELCSCLGRAMELEQRLRLARAIYWLL